MYDERVLVASALRRTERGDLRLSLRCYGTTTPGGLTSGRDHATALWGSSHRMLTHHIRVVGSEPRTRDIAQITLGKSFKHRDLPFRGYIQPIRLSVYAQTLHAINSRYDTPDIPEHTRGYTDPGCPLPD